MGFDVCGMVRDMTMTDKNKEALEALEQLMSVLCDPQGNASIRGSHGDLMIIDDSLRTIRNALKAQEWQPIETAPRDGSPILINVPSYGRCVYVAWNKDGKWIVFDAGNGQRAWVDATHWMPLPQPPKKGESQ